MRCPIKQANHSSRQTIRQQLRQARQSLSPAQQQQAAENLCQALMALPAYQQSSRIACYLASDGEIDLEPSIQQLCEAGKQCYLPRVLPEQGMEFRRFEPGQRLASNQYGIAEPDEQAELCPAEQLDLVLLPLVGFSRDGARLGMGGGYYDRAFAFKAQRSEAAPQLIGIAHHFQELDSLDVESWDIPLSGVLSDRGFIACE